METQDRSGTNRYFFFAALVVASIVALVVLWLAGQRDPAKPTDGGGASGPGDPVTKQPAVPKLVVRFDRDTYWIRPDTEIQVTIDRLADAPEGLVLTDRMLDRTKLEWNMETEGSRKFLPDGSIESSGHSSPHYGCLSAAGNPSYKEPAEIVRLPATVKLGLVSNFTDTLSSKVRPGTYRTTVAVIGHRIVVRSDPVTIRLVAPGEAADSKPGPSPAP